MPRFNKARSYSAFIKNSLRSQSQSLVSKELSAQDGLSDSSCVKSSESYSLVLGQIGTVPRSSLLVVFLEAKSHRPQGSFIVYIAGIQCTSMCTKICSNDIWYKIIIFLPVTPIVKKSIFQSSSKFYCFIILHNSFQY